MTEIKKLEYSITEEVTLQAENDYKTVPSGDDEVGYKLLKLGCKSLTTMRTSVDKRRKQLKRDIQETSDFFLTRIAKLENPYKAEKKRVDDIAKNKEQERIQKISDALNHIRDMGIYALGSSSGLINCLIVELEKLEIKEEAFQEQLPVAVNLKSSILGSLMAAYDRAILDEEQKKQNEIEAEKLRIEREKLEAEKAELAAEREKRRLEKEVADITKGELPECIECALRGEPVIGTEVAPRMAEVIEKITKVETKKAIDGEVFLSENGDIVEPKTVPIEGGYYTLMDGYTKYTKVDHKPAPIEGEQSNAVILADDIREYFKDNYYYEDISDTTDLISEAIVYNKIPGLTYTPPE